MIFVLSKVRSSESSMYEITKLQYSVENWLLNVQT